VRIKRVVLKHHRDPRGSISVTRWRLIQISPLVTRSSPATMRSSVDFPQPDGPTHINDKFPVRHNQRQFGESPGLCVTACSFKPAILFLTIKGTSL
jgi:hypothetical protein